MKIYQIKVTVMDIEPPIWRRIVVPSKIAFFKLHKIIQVAFGWQDYHLFGFDFENATISLPDEDGFAEVRDKNAKKEKIDAYLEKGVEFGYTYDYGDNWEHHIIVENVLEGEQGQKYPVCLDGERHRPPEDVGGIPGYENFLEIISNPKHEEYNEMLQWSEKDTGGKKFDPEYFYLAEVNKALAKIK
jgi:hypothetical protein